jgi:hypothetical protein
LTELDPATKRPTMVMGHNHTVLAIPLVFLAVSTASLKASTSQQNPETPTFRVEVRGDLAAELTTRVAA